ncbi:MAG: hypothetical protein ACQEQL_02110 [Pseudomonadota bacterium]
MFYNHSQRAQVIPDQTGYYAVFIRLSGKFQKHVVKARSDFDAALKVKTMTGAMPASDSDVVGPLPSSSHGYDKMTRDIWLGK